jgi:hypothetical protein
MTRRTCYYGVIFLLVFLVRPAVRCLQSVCTDDTRLPQLLHYVRILHNREWKKVTLIAIMEIEYHNAT